MASCSSPTRSAGPRRRLRRALQGRLLRRRRPRHGRALIGSRRASRDRLADALGRRPPWPRRSRHATSASSWSSQPPGRAPGSGTWPAVSSTGRRRSTGSMALTRRPAPDYEAYLAMIHPDDRAALRRRPSRRSSSRADSSTSSSASSWPDGSVHWTHGSGVPSATATGRPVTHGRHGPGHHRASTPRGAARSTARGGAPCRRVPRGLRRRHQPRAAHAHHDDPRADPAPHAARTHRTTPTRARPCSRTCAPSPSACTGSSRTSSC